MSFAGKPVDDASVRTQFLSARAAAGAPDDGWMRDLAGGAGSGAQTVAPASTTAPGAPPAGTEASQPFGVRFSNFLHAAHDAVFAKPGERDATLGGAVVGGIEGIPAEIKKEFMDGLHGMAQDSSDEQAFRSAHPQLTLPNGSASGADFVMHALGTAFAPLNGIFTSAGGRPIEQVTGVRRQVAGALLSMLAPGGLAGDAAKAGDAAEGAEGAAALDGAKAASGTPPPPPGAKGAAPPPPGQNGAGAAPGVSGAASPPPRGFDLAGDQPGATLKVTPAVRQQAADFFAGKRDNPIQVSLGMMANPDTAPEVINNIAKIIPKGSVKPLDVTMMNAYSLNMQPDEVMATLRPQFPSDETMAAASMAINSAGKAVFDLAGKAAETSAPEDVEAATRAYAQFNDFIGQFRAGKTDWGRAGRIQQEVQSSFDPYTQHIIKVAQDIGPDNVEELIRKIPSLEDPAKVPGWVSSLRWMGGREGMLYGWYNFLLSNFPHVVVKKLTSDLSIGLWNVATRGVAEAGGRLGANSGAVQPGETMALLNGYVGSMSDAFRAAGKALKAGQSQFYGDYQSLFDGRVMSRNNILAQATSPDLPPSTTRSALEFLKMAMPTSWIGAADDFAKVSNYRAELHALAWRRATATAAMRDEAAAKGAPFKSDLPDMTPQQHYRMLLDNVPQDLHDQAAANAIHNTLSDPLEGVGKAVQELVDHFNVGPVPLGRLIMPFTKIGANVMRMAYRNSPIGAVRFLRTQSLADELGAGGARRDLAQAQMGLGTAASLIFGTMVMSGRITGRGPSSPDLARARQNAGIPPYSIHLGDKWYGYNQVEPVGTTIGTVADTLELMHYAKDEDGEQLATSLALGIGNAMMSKTYMSGISNFLEALNNPDRDGARWMQNLIGSMTVPQGLTGVENATDPWVRQHYHMLDAIAARTPGFAESLPPARNVWGDPLPRAQGFPAILGPLSKMLSPVQEMPDSSTANPIDKWIWNNRDAFPNADKGQLGIWSPGPVMSVNGAHVQLTPAQTDRLKFLAGQGAKDPQTGLGAKGALNALVQGNYPDSNSQDDWNKGTPEARALMVGRIWQKYREMAKAQLIAEDGNLRDTIGAAQQAREQKLTQPSIGAGP